MKKGKKIFLISAMAAFLLAVAVMLTGSVIVNRPSEFGAGKVVSTASAKAAVLTQVGEQTVAAYQKEEGNSLVSYDKNGRTLWTHSLSTYYTLLEAVGENIFVGVGRTVEALDLHGNVTDSVALSYTPRSMSMRGNTLVFNSSLSAAKNLLSVFHYDGSTISLEYELDFNRNIVQTAVTEEGKVIFATTVAVFECLEVNGSYVAKKIFDSVNTVRGLHVDDKNNVYLSTSNGCLEVYQKTKEGYVGLKAVEYGKDASVISTDGNGLIATFDYEGNVLLYDTEAEEVYSSFRSYASAYALSMSSEGTLMAFKLDAPLSYYDTAKIGAVSFFQTIQTLTIVLTVVAALVLTVAAVMCFEKGEKKVKHVAWELGKNKDVYLFLIPTFALLAVFNYYTMVKGFSLAFQNYMPGVKAEFIGFANFVSVFQNVEFWSSTGNMVIFLITDILKALIPPFIIAEVIHSVNSRKAQYVSRFLMFLPGILPGVAGSLLWMDGIFGTDGLVSQMFALLGVEQLSTVNWLGNADTAKWALVMFGFPWVGNYLLFYGALRSIPDSIYDAADLDGFSWFTRLLRIDMPMIGAQMKYVFMTTFISSIQNFSRVFITTNGAFDTNIPALVLYQNITTHQNYGVASAMGLVLFVFIFGMAAYSMKSKKQAED